MACVNAAMAHPPPQTPIARRRGDIHPNLWNNCFIQSLSSPYSASSNHERREALCMEIKDMLKELGNADSYPSAENLVERFWTVDFVQCLGIGRHFQNEVKLMLDYSYKYWKEDGITLDLNATALGFRTLRLNGYHMSADVFNIFKDGDGQFFCALATKDTNSELRTMLNLYRASELVFPGETIMKEANIFTSKYLKHAVKEWEESNLSKNQLIMEVEYVLRYPWKCNVPRWEARNYIEIFKQDNTSIMKEKATLNKKLLDLAVLDFNILQCQHQRELKQVSRWWEYSSASRLDFFRHRHVEYYFWYACGLFEPEFAKSRIGFSKLTSMCTLLDDIYDTYGTLDELKPFTTALISRKIPTEGNLPDYMKISLEFSLQLLEEIEKEMEKIHGDNPDIKKFAEDSLKDYVLSYFKEAEWISSSYSPTLNEYLKNGHYSSGIPFLTMYSLLLMDMIPFGKVFKKNEFPSSKFQTLLPTIVRLVDDMTDFQDEEKRGESISIISCFKRDNLGSTCEDALNYAKSHVECYMEDVTREFLQSSHIPACCKNFHFNVALRGIFFMYNDGDGIYFANKEIKNAINKILIEPMPL